MKLKKYDMHGKTCQDLERLVLKLSNSHDVVIFIVGKGSGALRSKLINLSHLFGFRLVYPTDNGSEFICDFITEVA